MTNKKQIKIQAEKHLEEISYLFNESLDITINYIDNTVWPFIESTYTLSDYIGTLLDDMSRFINDELSLRDAGDCGIISSLLHSYDDLIAIKQGYIDEHLRALQMIISLNTEEPSGEAYWRSQLV